MRSSHPIPIALLIAASSLGLACRQEAPTHTAGPESVARVGGVAVTSGRVEETLETLGRVELDPRQIRTVAFVTSGQVRQVLVRPGQGVTAGAGLLALGPLPGDSLEVRQARIDLEYALAEQERLERLLERRLATNEQVQQAAKAVSNARAALAAMGAGDTGPIRAPFAGIVRDVLVTAGAIVHAGEPAVLLAPTSAVVVRAGFEPEDLAELATGLAATVEPVLSPDGEGAATGRLAELHSVVDPDTQLVEVVVEPDRPPRWMIPGTTVRVRLVVGSAADAVLVPRAALLTRDGGRGVFVIDGDRARWTPLEIGVEGESVVEARFGVAAGARVVITGRSLLADGMAVVEGAAEPAP